MILDTMALYGRLAVDAIMFSSREQFVELSVNISEESGII